MVLSDPYLPVVSNKRSIYLYNFGRFNHLYDGACNARSHKRNQLILNFMTKIIILQLFVFNASKVVLALCVLSPS